jgi:protein SCO1/2
MLTLCADVCPFTTGNLLQVAAKLHTKGTTGVHIVAFSVDPTRDTRARLLAYAKRLGISPSSSLLQFWRGDGVATSAVMKFFGMRADHLAVEDPAPRDWLTGKPITYDVDHSDGFFVLDGQHRVKFISGLAPRFVGALAKALKGYLTADGLQTLEHPGPGWTPNDALQALSYVARRPL